MQIRTRLEQSRRTRRREHLEVMERGDPVACALEPGCNLAVLLVGWLGALRKGARRVDGRVPVPVDRIAPRAVRAQQLDERHVTTHACTHEGRIAVDARLGSGGTVLKEHAGGREVAAAARLHKRRPAALCAQPHVGAVLDQQSCDLFEARRACNHERRRAEAAALVDGGAPLDQQPHRLVVPVVAGEHDRAPPLGVRLVDE